ncbi:MAG: DUF134 domain-containing protein [Candidatus Thorarchaeota archaeon]
MPRRRRCRLVSRMPPTTVFKPAGVPARCLEEVVLTVDELEALRLSDLEGLDQRDASERMEVSQPTFNRTLNSARQKVATALVNGWMIRIEGGSYVLGRKDHRDVDSEYV